MSEAYRSEQEMNQQDFNANKQKYNNSQQNGKGGNQSVQKLAIAGGLLLFGLLGMYATSGSSQPEGDFSLNSEEAQSANSFEKIQIASRIMPSQNTEGNMIIMDPMNVESEFEQNFSDQSVETLRTDAWFGYNQTNEYFPTLHLKEEYAPLGTAKPYCLHLGWIKKEQRQMIDRYYHVQGFPTCSGASNAKTRWQQNDPKTGVDFNVWRQIGTDANSQSDCADNGIFVGKMNEDGPGKCYRYEVLQALCVQVAYVEHPDTVSYSWDYEGGCFANGEYAYYKPAQIGETYNFNYVPIEVRQSSADFSTEVVNATGFTFSGFFFWLSFVAFVAGLVLFGLAFKDQILQLVNRKGANPHQPQVDEA